MWAWPCCSGIVSIPERVWGGLEHYFLKSSMCFSLFQSLRGFGVGWSQIDIELFLASGEYVSIPERVWGGLEL